MRKLGLSILAIALLGTPAIAAPTAIPARINKPPELNAPTVERGQEIQEPPKADDNPFVNPNLDDLIEKQINQDIWEQLKGDLPCVQATPECIEQLQSNSQQNSRLLQEIDQRIEEAQSRVDEAKLKNEQNISISTFSPYLQAYLGNTLSPIKSQTGSSVLNPLNLVTSNLLGILGGQFFSLLFPWQNQTLSDASATRSIAIGDLQIKIAELQRSRAEIANKIREKAVMETLKLEEAARDFQIQQEIGKRDRDRLEIIKVSYRFGEGSSESYLSQLSAYDRQKAIAWRNWAALRSQLTRVRLLVKGE
jgi:hypothetical protein